MTPDQIEPYPVVDAVINVFATWLKHRREVAEICDCDAQDYARIAYDLGMSSDELNYLVRRGPHAADELPKMMTALGIDAEAVARAYPAVIRDMERVCAHCDHKRRCHEELATGDAPESYADYCENASTLESLGAKS